MLGALGALIRKDERTLFSKNNDDLYINAPKLSNEEEREFIEKLGYEIHSNLITKWDKHFPKICNDDEFIKIKNIFKKSRLRILYASDESHEWVIYIDNNIFNDTNDNTFNNNDNNNDNTCIAGVYQKFNFEFGDGKFHDIISMGTTKNIGWIMNDCCNYNPLLIYNVGETLSIFNKYNNIIKLPNEIIYLILEFSIDCFKPIHHMMESDIILKDIRRWTQNLYLSDYLRKIDDNGDITLRQWGRIFVEIGNYIDQSFAKYKKKFSLIRKASQVFSNKWTKIRESIKNIQTNHNNNNNDNNPKRD